MSDWTDDIVIDEGETSEHATLAPSSAARWIICPGSVFAEAGEEDRPSKYSIEGGAAHKVAAAALVERMPASAYIGRIFTIDGKDVEVTDTMVDEVQPYIDRINDLVKSTGGVLLVEQRLDISKYVGAENQFGTGDAIILVPEQREIVVCDLKFGKGVRVSAYKNEQMRLYALGALDAVEPIVGTDAFDKVRMIIDQVRLDGFPGEYAESVADLKTWAYETAVPAGKLAMEMFEGKRAPEYKASDKGCRFCKFAHSCPEAARVATETALSDYTVNPIAEAEPTPREAPTGVVALSIAAKKVPFVKAWAAAVMARLEHLMIQQGVEVPDFKVVEGRKGDRAWSDTDAVASSLSGHPTAEIYEPRKLKSPAKMEKEPELKKSSALAHILKEYVKQADGRLTVAPATDSRKPAPVSTPANDFLNVDTTEIL